MFAPLRQSMHIFPKDDEDRKSNYARRKFIVSILDRTYTTYNFFLNSYSGITNVATGTKQIHLLSG